MNSIVTFNSYANKDKLHNVDFTIFINLLTCLASIFSVAEVSSVPFSIAILTISRIVSLEYLFKGTQKSGITACVDPQFSQTNLGTTNFTLIKTLFTFIITFLEYEELNIFFRTFLC